MGQVAGETVSWQGKLKASLSQSKQKRVRGSILVRCGMASSMSELIYWRQLKFKLVHARALREQRLALC